MRPDAADDLPPAPAPLAGPPLDPHGAAYRQARDDGNGLGRLQALPPAELRQLAAGLGCELATDRSRRELVFAILQRRCLRELTFAAGVLEIMADGFGFLRSPQHGYEHGPDDVYVSPSQVQRLDLRAGHWLSGPIRAPHHGEKYLALQHVDEVNGTDLATARRRMAFEHRTPIVPRQRLRLDHPGAAAGLRLLDLLAPWGRGQRVLCHAPPEANVAAMLADLGAGLQRSNAAVHTIVCLLDARPEDVTEARRCGTGESGCEVVATTFDQPPARHVAVAELCVARAQRLVESGRDVVVLLDSLTALVRAQHLELPHSGRMLTAGLDAAALLRPKQLFASARCLEEGGSLTMLATLTADPASRLDQAIAEELRGRGNSDVVFDRTAPAETEPWAALDVVRTLTRREDSLLPTAAQRALHALRAASAAMPPAARREHLLALLRQHPTNDDLLLAPR